MKHKTLRFISEIILSHRNFTDLKVHFDFFQKSHPSATNQLICDYRTKKMMSRYSQSSYVPEKSSKYYYLKNLKKAPTNNPDWRKYLKVV